MRGIGPRIFAVTLALFVSSGMGIAFAEERVATVRLPIDLRPDSPGTSTVVVVEGDHLWKISKRHLEGRWHRAPSNSEVGPYWRDVIDENLAHLKSGDPDLIYPGEVIELPDPGLSAQR